MSAVFSYLVRLSFAALDAGFFYNFYIFTASEQHVLKFKVEIERDILSQSTSCHSINVLNVSHSLEYSVVVGATIIIIFLLSLSC